MEFRNRLVLIAGWVLISATAVMADPPARVARISYIQGPVSIQRGDLEDWNQAVVNYPLVASDNLWTDEKARAEVHVGSIALRLADRTSISFLTLNDQTLQVRLAEGTVDVSVPRLGQDDRIEIDTPSASVSLTEPGEYRVDVDESGRATFVARRGEEEVTTSGDSFTVASYQQATVENDAAAAHDMSTAMPFDDFDRWANTRESREENSVSSHYVSPEMIGYEDLDQYGQWSVMPDYGNVWRPTSVPVGWSPYSLGQWSWIEPYGWTWVDDEPWGFAPFHYGRWAYLNDSWFWAPGPILGRPVFAPALVSFIGGSNWGLSFGFGGGVGWFPLGPGEFYRPGYFVSDRYIGGLNPGLNIRLAVTNRFMYRDMPRAITVVSHDGFIGGRPVALSRLNVEPRFLAGAPLLGATAPIAPIRESLLIRNDRINVARPPAFVRDRIVQTRMQPGPAAVPFAARASALSAAPGRPLDRETLSRLRAEAPAVPARNPSVPFSASRQGPERATPESRPSLREGSETRMTPERPNLPEARTPAPSYRPAPPTRSESPRSESAPRHIEHGFSFHGRR
jgi:hypothetical protein